MYGTKLEKHKKRGGYKMKKILSFLCMFTMAFTLAACGSRSGSRDTSGVEPPASQPVHSQGAGQTEGPGQPSKESGGKPGDTEQGKDEAADTEGEVEDSHILVAYFSATGTTKALAEYAVDAMGADIYEIVPKEPYTDADLDYGDSGSRSSLEQNDAGARPAISGSVEDMGQYDTVFLAYPIWWGEAPRIVYTFMESYDFSGKTIVPFCTSGGSGIGSSAKNLHGLASSGVTWLDGKRLSSSSSRDDMVDWINSLALDVAAE